MSEKNKKQKIQKPSPLQALEFLEDFRKLKELQDEPTEPISIRVPSNILRTTKSLAKIKGSKYQTLFIKWIREGLTRET